MTRERAKEFIPLIQAFAEGKKIQVNLLTLIILGLHIYQEKKVRVR